MAEDLLIQQDATREEKYKVLLPQLEALLDGETDLIARLSNFTAAIKDTFGFLWVGFYKVAGSGTKKELVLGPFQGPVACMRIGYGKGVCGKAWEQKQTIVVENVDKFPGHIACSSLSRSEIVLPIILNGEVIMVLDIDSVHLNDFTDTDAIYLKRLLQLIEKKL